MAKGNLLSHVETPQPDAVLSHTQDQMKEKLLNSGQEFGDAPLHIMEMLNGSKRSRLNGVMSRSKSQSLLLKKMLYSK